MRTTQAPKNKKIIIATAISVIVLIAAGYGIFAYAQSAWPFSKESPTSDSNNETKDTDSLNANDPTYPTDKNQGNDDKPATNTDTQTDKSNVQVGISSAGKFNDSVEVRAFMSGVIEGSGTCTATFTNGSQTLTATSSAFIDTHTTQCQPILFDANQFSTGTWTVVVSYDSPGYNGKSSPMEVTL